MPIPARLLPFAAAAAFAALPGSVRSQSPGPAAPAAAEAPRYGRDVRPILADRCFRCHGPDAARREAGLQLDERAAALAGGKHGPAIVPGDPAASLLWQRVTSPDPRCAMPPATSGKPPLTEDERAVVERWIRAGAPYEPHWAFVPPARPPVPGAGAGWARNDVDRFVAQALAAHGLQPSAEADRGTLLRRLFLVLTGLPPTPQELAAFVADPAPDAYERMVDRIFAEEPYRSRHAEHFAGPWLDAARYADTSGIHMDAGRQIWPWRDWLLSALRDDQPFDQFVIDQLAGDLKPDATTPSRVATGFLRTHVTTDEGGAIDEEYRVEYACERTNTLGSALLGLTLGCARCHEHKYDPIGHEDYYRLYAFFNTNREPGLYSQSPDNNRALEPFLGVPTPAEATEQARLDGEVAAADADLRTVPPDEQQQRAAFTEALRTQAGLAWPAAGLVAAHSRGGATLTTLPDGSVLASGANPARDTHELIYAAPAADLRLVCLEALPDASLPGGRVGRAPNGNAVLSALRLSVRPRGSEAPFRPVPLVWAFADYEQPDGDYRVVNALDDDARGWAVGAHLRPLQPVRALFLAGEPFGGDGVELRVELAYESIYAEHAFGRVRLRFGTLRDETIHRLPLARGAFYTAGPFPAAEPQTLYEHADAPALATAIREDARFGEVRWRHAPEIREGAPFAGLPQGRNSTYVAQPLFAPSARDGTVSLGSDDGFRLFVDGERRAGREVDRAVAADQDEATVPLAAGRHLLVLQVVNTNGAGGCFLRYAERVDELGGDLPLLLLPDDARDPALTARLDDAWRERFSPTFAARRAHLRELTAARDALAAKVARTMVWDEGEPRPTFVLQRGDYDKPDKNRPVQRGLPRFFTTADAPPVTDRLALARWLVSDRDPLLLRVQCNRLWEFVFGTGLVRTSEDFGHQGEWPSHPELLDWLATELRAQGFHRRAILRLLVTSSTFRQQSRTPEAARAADPQDRLLGWFPRRRLTAEAIRDQALYAAGLLVEHFGGPSVKPYQPAGLWQEVAMIQSNTRVYEQGHGEALWRRSLYTYWKRACPPPSLLVLDAPTREFCTIRRSSTNTPLQALALWNDEQYVEAARALAQRTLAEAGDDAARLREMFARCTGQTLAAPQLAAAATLLDRSRARYAADPAAAKAAVATGEAPRPAGTPDAELAAWSLVASAFLNLDSTLCIE